MGVGWEWEQSKWKAGRVCVAGVDEAGRGPIAGPVVAAAVVLPRDCRLPGLNDSKQLTPKERNSLHHQIVDQALAWAVASETSEVIDQINILKATFRAMASAVGLLDPQPDCLLVDGSHPILFTFSNSVEQIPIVKGDGKSASIAAASILAKVARDGAMEEFDRLYPGYGFAQHKGYGTKAHLQALARMGPCPIHRKTFRPVRDMVEPAETSEHKPETGEETLFSAQEIRWS